MRFNVNDKHNDNVNLNDNFSTITITLMLLISDVLIVHWIDDYKFGNKDLIGGTLMVVVSITDL